MNILNGIDDNLKILNEKFKDFGDLTSRKLSIGTDTKTDIFVAYIDMMVNRTLIESAIFTNLMVELNVSDKNIERFGNVFDYIKGEAITSADIKEATTFKEIGDALLSGDTIIFVDGFEKALVFSTKGWPNRGVQTADNEVSVQGSNEAFSDVFRFNSSLIRRRIKDTNLKLQQFQIGRRSKTSVGVMYMEDLVREDILGEALSRLQSFDVDAVYDSGNIVAYMEDNSKSPFPQCQITQRPDKASSALLEGRVVILIDNCPTVIIIPTTMNTLFQASDDYTSSFQVMSFVRVLRFICGFMALCLPGLYLATAVFHPDMIPDTLIFKMAAARELVPFPALVEILLMELAFEMLREAGIRLPNPVGSAIGVVGGLVIGNAAVEAGIVSPIVVIIIALTGISSFTIPSYSLSSAFRIAKYLITILSGFFGFFGFWLAALIVLTHLGSLKSFGIPYLFPYVSGEVNDFSDLEDSIFVFPLFKMKKRPIYTNKDASTRIGSIKR